MAQMIGSLVLRTARALLGNGLTLEPLTVIAVLHSDEVPSAL